MSVTTHIDEMSLVFLLNDIDSLEKWSYLAPEIIREIDFQLDLNSVFGSYSKADFGFAGYSTVYVYKEDPTFLLQICYNESMPNMGIYIHFTALSFKKLLETKQIMPYDLIKEFKELEKIFDGTAHASRVDVAIDFLDEDIVVNDLYKKLVNNEEFLVNKDNKKNTSKIDAVINNKNVNTIYVGSKKKSTRLLMRIYDKKNEQLTNNRYSAHYLEAKHCNNWVRFEASFRQIYAKQISSELSKINNKKELSGFLFNLFCAKYRFFVADKEDYSLLTKVMLAYAEGDYDVLDGRKPRESNLEISINYLCTNSGLMPTLYKIEKFYGQKGIDDFITFIFDYYQNIYEVNKDAYNYVNKYFDEYSKREKFPWRELSKIGGIDHG